MKHRFLFLLVAFSLPAYPQSWSTFLDPSRAIDWMGVGFTIPNYTTNCSTQPSLTANALSAATANTTAIQNALASCDATHNVVSIPAGTYYVAGWTFGTQGKQVVRGAGPMSTYIYLTATVGCSGIWPGICMSSQYPQYDGAASAMPPSGGNQCMWTGGYAKGTTKITLASCGTYAGQTGPTPNQMLILDQANDSADTGGVYLWDSYLLNCTIENSSNNADGRHIGGVTYSQKQITYITGVSNNGNGTYSVTISPGVYFNNIRAGQTPGAWWPNMAQNDGLENLSIDISVGGGGLAMFTCYQCWVKNIRSMYAGRSHILLMESANDVVRDSYFYQAQGHGSQSYAVEFESASRVLVENNIFQQTTNSIMFGQSSGSVIGYNYSVDNQFGTGAWAETADAGHNAGNGMNLWEGNNFFGIWSDVSWGASTVETLFRNMLIGWQNGKTEATYPVSLQSWSRGFNVVGNVLGQPSYHSGYESYATSSSGGVNGGDAAVNKSIYSLGWTGDSGVGGCISPPVCDPAVRTTLMRWGNYDTVTGGTKWNSTEASPAGVPYINSNFTSSYFSSLAQTLPASLYYSSRPSWWPTTKAWPPAGPDVSSGNLGICSGTYAGAQATASAQCTGGGWSSEWAAHANSIPAQDCYLNVMQGPPDGSGNVLNFDANLCYSPSKPASPTGLAVTVH